MPEHAPVTMAVFVVAVSGVSDEDMLGGLSTGSEIWGDGVEPGGPGSNEGMWRRRRLVGYHIHDVACAPASSSYQLTRCGCDLPLEQFKFRSYVVGIRFG